MRNRQKEINKLRSRYWRLNEKFLQLINDGYPFDSIEVQWVLVKIKSLDSQMDLLRIGRV